MVIHVRSQLLHLPEKKNMGLSARLLPLPHVVVVHL
jgi:hypothetical protein